MPKIDRLSGYSDWIDLSYLERERTPRQLMELGIRLHFAGLSLSNTVRELGEFGVERSRKAAHGWIHKCDLRPADDEKPNHVTLDETVIQLDEHRYWPYTAVDPETNKSPIYGCIRRPRPRWQNDSCKNSLRNMTSTMPCFSSMG